MSKIINRDGYFVPVTDKEFLDIMLEERSREFVKSVYFCTYCDEEVPESTLDGHIGANDGSEGFAESHAAADVVVAYARFYESFGKIRRNNKFEFFASEQEALETIAAAEMDEAMNLDSAPQWFYDQNELDEYQRELEDQDVDSLIAEAEINEFQSSQDDNA